MFRLVAVLIALVLSASTTLADPVGTYEVTGTNPGIGSKYSGMVVVQRTGDTFQVTWAYPSGERVIGIGIGKATISRFRTGMETTSVSPCTLKPETDGLAYGHLPVVLLLERSLGNA